MLVICDAVRLSLLAKTFVRFAVCSQKAVLKHSTSFSPCLLDFCSQFDIRPLLRALGLHEKEA